MGIGSFATGFMEGKELKVVVEACSWDNNKKERVESEGAGDLWSAEGGGSVGLTEKGKSGYENRRGRLWRV